MKEIKKEIINIVEDFLLEGEANEEASLANDLSIGTFEFLEMIAIIQDTFNVDIEDNDIGKLVTVNDLITYVENKSN